MLVAIGIFFVLLIYWHQLSLSSAWINFHTFTFYFLRSSTQSPSFSCFHVHWNTVQNSQDMEPTRVHWRMVVHIHGEYYSVIKMEISVASIWMEQEDVMLSEVSYLQCSHLHIKAKKLILKKGNMGRKWWSTGMWVDRKEILMMFYTTCNN